MAIKPVSGEVKSQDINDNLSYLDSKLDQVNAGPLGTLNSVSELNSKYPNGANGYFVVLESDGKTGYMYTWDGSKWVKGALYQSMGIAEKGVTSTKLTGPNKPNLVVSKYLFDFQISKSKIQVKTGGIRVGNEVFGFSDSEIDYKDKANQASVLNFVFNITTKYFEILTNPEYTNIKNDCTLIAVIDVINKVISSNMPHMVDGQDFSKSVLGDFALMGNLEKPIVFDLKKYKIIIPKTTNIWVNNKYYNSQQVTNGVDLELKVPQIASEMVLVFNTNTLVFEILTSIEFNNMSIYNVLIAFFSITFNKVFMVGNYKVIDDQIDSDVINQYFLDEIQRLNNDIGQINNRDKLSLGFITDTHGFNSHIRNVVESTKSGQFDYLIHGGDFLVMETTKEKARIELDKYAKTLSNSKVPVLTTLGNHDNDNQVGDMNPAEVANRIIWSNKNTSYRLDKYKGYYVIDDERRKIRIVMTNSTISRITEYNNWGWDKEQLQWLMYDALNIDSEWHVLVVGHHNARQQFSNVPKAKNGEEMLNILKAFKEGASYVNDELGLNHNFENKGNLICYLFGHTHCDTLTNQSDLGFYQVSTASSKPDFFEPGTVPIANTSWERPTGTKNEDCWDVFIIDPSKRNVKIRRFGAGENREFDY